MAHNPGKFWRATDALSPLGYTVAHQFAPERDGMALTRALDDWPRFGSGIRYFGSSPFDSNTLAFPLLGDFAWRSHCVGPSAGRSAGRVCVKATRLRF
jgi:hypothetical protein